MKTRKSGARHPLLFYRHTMDRIGSGAFVLGVVAAVGGWFALLPARDILGVHSDIWFFALAVLSFGLAAFAFLARFLAFVQARENFLLISTPFLRLRISYQRIHSVRPTLTQQIFPPDRLSWAQRQFIEPFYGKTSLVVVLLSFPVNQAMLKLFLPGMMFPLDHRGLVLAVSDWMRLSTEIDSYYGAWLQTQGRGRPGRR